MSYCETFRLPIITPLLNVTLRTNRWRGKNMQGALCMALRVASNGRRPPAPLQRARVTIERHSVGVPDYDGLVGGMKGLIDCLLVPRVIPSKKNGIPKVRHAMGLCFVVDDAPKHLDLVMRGVRCKRADIGMVITVEDCLRHDRPALH